MNYCSKIIECKISMEIKCIHCDALNLVSQTMDDDSSKSDIEEITCWSCGKESLVDELLLDFYPEYPNESVSGHHFGEKCKP